MQKFQIITNSMRIQRVHSKAAKSKISVCLLLKFVRSFKIQPNLIIQTDLDFLYRRFTICHESRII